MQNVLLRVQNIVSKIVVVVVICTALLFSIEQYLPKKIRHIKPEIFQSHEYINMDHLELDNYTLDDSLFFNSSTVGQCEDI